MSVEFNENNLEYNKFQSRVVLGLPQTPKMIQFLVNKNIVKDEKSAGILLLCLMGICFVIAGYFIFSISRPADLEYNLSPDLIDALPEEIKTKIYEIQKK